MEKLKGYSLVVDGGKISNLTSSTIVEITDEVNILREGAVSKEEILKIF